MNDVHVAVKDGGLGLSIEGADGVHVKIGVSTAVVLGLITMNGNSDVQEILAAHGYSPMASALMDAIQAGAKTIYCIPCAGSVAGTNGAVTHTGTGTATYAVTGTPKNAYEVVIEILKDGGLNAATYRASVDGGDNFTEEITIPVGGAVVLANTGVTITFTAGAPADGSFKKGDVYTFSTTAPSMSNEEVLAALAVAKELMTEYEYIHIIGESSETMWAAVAAEMDTFFTNKFNPTFAICEARNKLSTETLDEYVQDLIASRAAVNNYRVQVVAARGELSAKDGKIRDTNLAGTVSGLYGRTAVGKSIGEVSAVQLSAVTKLLPVGIDKHIEALDAAGFLTARQYIGLAGFYITNARMLAPVGSDYQYAEILRPMNKLIKETRKQALFNMQMQVNPADMEGSLKLIAEFLKIPGERMVDDKELAAVNVEIPEGQDVLGASLLRVKVQGTPMATLRSIDIEFGMVNPFL